MEKTHGIRYGNQRRKCVFDYDLDPIVYLSFIRHQGPAVGVGEEDVPIVVNGDMVTVNVRWLCHRHLLSYH